MGSFDFRFGDGVEGVHIHGPVAGRQGTSMIRFLGRALGVHAFCVFG